MTDHTHLSTWTAELRALFPVADEYELAAAIYSFTSAFEDGMTPQQAYDDFDEWTSCDADSSLERKLRTVHREMGAT